MRAAALLLLTASPALAWESVCIDAQGRPCAPAAGPNTARNRWLGPLDEHRQLWDLTRLKAGLPAAVANAITLDVYTASASVQVGAALAPTLAPAPFESATRKRQRTFTIAELAQLPDFSYALWDWASGNEQCPLLDGTDPTLCHDFASHMGPVNSNHFAPQAQGFYARYHARALVRAAECKAFSDALAGSGGRFAAYEKACELEALTLEAVGHHFLQDAWSMGHMWQRWGSANLSEFPGASTDEKRDRAVLVALVSGFIHGARGVLQQLPNWTSYDVNDAMCAPWPDVRFVDHDGTLSPAVGDDYLGQMTPLQSQRFYDCATSGVLAVYQSTGMAHGPASPQPGLASVDPTGEVCFGQRATNQAMVRGMAIHLKVLGVQADLPVDARFASWMIPQVARATGKVPVAKKTKNEFRMSLMRVTTLARIEAKDHPTATTLADGAMGDFMGISPNGQYPLVAASYEDPALPWRPDGPARAATLARAFHQAHAAEWCAVTDVAALGSLKTHAADPTLDSEARAAACSACTELVQRHLRLGTSASWDTAREPLCHFVGSTQYVYGSSAAAWCCP
ncbi:MAG: hypothetical protein IPJ65_33920 [Archangiaceae bacterium]|nr:hypothetical protein [Archangiaceae bacterium]